ncbi:helix-turn-helix domain-containing protein [Pigmentiphaga aceris]|uniref:Helix-turn-helix domain-containing protein n=1 Tax=Pigmentiphaga aceris TaxID=1940612 RepID=A0A5C0AUW1_9BURK|nr:helix-turn-helix transcriptional regulator [Pigmentiphaga aceris]QEI04461.1 helix-turn-helix domain-containing protein [Pigmentiphaga aceris]
MTDHTLGQFIRKHRERLLPQDVGLPALGRRRTPGLRREELAQLCGVSPTWLTWIEQGRPVTASTDMLARLTDALRLSAAERQYLFALAGRVDPAGAADNRSQHADAQAIIAHLLTPAYVLDRAWNAVAWNPAAADLFVGWLDAASTPLPNLLRYTFLCPAARHLIAPWEERARRLVAEFRNDCGRHAADPDIRDLVAELSHADPTFARFWQNYDVVPREGGRRDFLHPTKGPLRFMQTTWQAATQRDLKLVVLVAEPDA